MAHWSGPVAIILVGLAMLRLTWRTWPDVLIDFGRELYVPWRLAAGQVLYTDVAYFNGPLSPYWNSLWFRLFGASFMTLVASNLILLALLTALLYVILREIASRVSATAACLVFTMLFAFGQFLEVGNYNFATPYSPIHPRRAALRGGALLPAPLPQAPPADLRRCRWAGRRPALSDQGRGLPRRGGRDGDRLGLTLCAERPDRRRLRNFASVFLAAAAAPSA